MKLSIITISYNNLQGIKLTAESIIKQTFSDYEWIVIDGNSKDGTKEYLEQIVPQPTYWISEPDNGIYDAMNKGISKANGEWCIFMNSGDTFYDNYVLDKVFSRFPDHGDIIYCDAIFKYDNADLYLQYPEKLDLIFFYFNSICHQATFIKTQLLVDSHGYSTDYRIVSDWRSWVIWIKQGRDFVHLPVIVCNFDTGGIGSTKDQEAEQERKRVLKEFIPEYVMDILNRTAPAEHHILKLHEQFGNKAIVRVSFMIKRKNWFIRRIVRSFIHVLYFIDKFIHRNNYTAGLSDSHYNAEQPTDFEKHKFIKAKWIS